MFSVSVEDSSALSLFPPPKTNTAVRNYNQVHLFYVNTRSKDETMGYIYFYPSSYKYLSVILRL